MYVESNREYTYSTSISYAVTTLGETENQKILVLIYRQPSPRFVFFLGGERGA